jgi:transposase
LDGLKDRHRSGRPPDVPKEMLSKIRRELSESPSGWKAKEIMDIIYKRTGVRYHHEVHVYRLLHKWGFRPKVPQSTTKEICNYSIKRRERTVQKKVEEIILNIPKGFTIMVEDDSVFLYDALIRRRMWTPEGSVQ